MYLVVSRDCGDIECSYQVRSVLASLTAIFRREPVHKIVVNKYAENVSEILDKGTKLSSLDAVTTPTLPIR